MIVPPGAYRSKAQMVISPRVGRAQAAVVRLFLEATAVGGPARLPMVLPAAWAGLPAVLLLALLLLAGWPSPPRGCSRLRGPFQTLPC